MNTPEISRERVGQLIIAVAAESGGNPLSDKDARDVLTILRWYQERHDEAGGTPFLPTAKEVGERLKSVSRALVGEVDPPAPSPSLGLSIDEEMEHWVRSWRTVCQTGGCDTCQLSRGGPAKAECERYAALIKARLSSPAPDADERALSRCTCRPEYKDRGLSDPQCPFHSMTNREWLARELGIEVPE